MDYFICLSSVWLFFGIFYCAVELASKWDAVVASHNAVPLYCRGRETHNILALMHWHWTQSERTFNYCSETIEVHGFLEAIGRKIWMGIQRIIPHTSVFAYIIAAIAVALGVYYGSSGNEMLFMGAAGLMGAPKPKDSRKDKEVRMYLRVEAAKVWKRAREVGDAVIHPLLKAIFGAAYKYFDYSKTIDVPVFTLVFNKHGVLIGEEPVMVTKPGETEPVPVSYTHLRAHET